jgi:hypothetical protein
MIVSRHLGHCVLLLVLGACGGEKPEPEIASSAPHESYAASYPERVEGEITGVSDGQIKVKERADGFSKYPEELDSEKMDYEVGAQLMERADEVGRSRAYVDGLREVRAVEDFYKEEKEELRRKVGGACQYAAKQAGCDKPDIGGASMHALDKTMEERIEERLHEANAAHALLDRHREEFGEKNVETLERQIDEVSEASYIAYIDMVEHKVRLRAMVEEAERVKQTAEDAIEAEKELQKQSGRTDKEKEASSKRIEAFEKAKSSMKATVDKANRTLEDIEERIEKTQKQYEEALERLLESYRKKAKK